MMSNMKRIAALVLAVMMVLSMLPGALAAEYFSGSLSVGGRVKRATPAPTEVPAEATPAPEAPVEPETPVETEVPAETEAPVEPEAPVATEAPVEPETPVTEEPVVEVTPEPTPELRKGMIYKKGDDDVANIRALPTSDSDRLGKAHHGDMVTVYDQDGSWLYVEVIGIMGWVHGNMVTFDESLFDIAEPTPAPIEEPVIEEVVETEPTEEPVIEEVVETEPTEEPVVEEVVETEPTEEPVVEEVVETEPTEEPVVEEVVETEPTEEPVVEEVVETEPTEETEEQTEVLEPSAEPEASVEPTVEPSAEPEASVEPTVEPSVEPEASVEPTIEPTATPEPQITWERDAEGKLVIDENGNPVAIVPEGMEAPAAYMRDEAGLLVYDVYGNPIPVAAEATVEPTVEPSAEPVANEEPETEEVFQDYEYELNEDGTYKLDEAGNPIAIVLEGQEKPVSFMKDETGALVLAENGKPIVLATVPANADIVMSVIDELNPDRRMDVYADWGGDTLYFGDSAMLIAVPYGYDNAVYTVQWQTSADNTNWEAVPNGNSLRCEVVVTQDNYMNYWRIQVTVEDILEQVQ